MSRNMIVYLLICILSLPVGLVAQPYEGVKADVDNDGTITVLDILKIINYRLTLITLDNEEYWRADCNDSPGECDGDGQVNILDAVKIANNILGNDECPNMPPWAVFTIDPLSGTTGTIFMVDATGCSDNEDPVTALQVHWDWENDGTYDTFWSTGKVATHRYPTPGTRTILLEVRDTGGLTDTVSLSVEVMPMNTPPTASFVVDPSSGTTDQIFMVDASGSFDSEDPAFLLQVRWDWENDGLYDTDWSATKTASHQYATGGTQTILLEVKDTEGLTDTQVRQVTVSPVLTTMTDIDGNEYLTVKIGSQEWMAENLKVTRYRNGDPIPFLADDAQWDTLRIGACCYYDNEEEKERIYGRLYNWYAVNDDRSIAPEGWHVPSDSDWMQLELSLGMDQSETDNVLWRGTDVGGKMKATGTTYWSPPNTGATNESGFSALPGGYRYGLGLFSYINHWAFFWSSTEHSEGYVWYRQLSFDESGIYRYSLGKEKGFSIRCVRD